MTTYKITKYLVGGAVRDKLLGRTTKDYDYTIVVDGASTVEEAWDAMRSWMIELGFTIFLEKPEYMVIRAKFPKGDPLAGETADFVLARKEGPYSDNRHPDWVEVGTLGDDLRRRDFTINALAQDDSGEIIDLFQGQQHLEYGVLVAVGTAMDRLREDPLRAFRAIRFAVTKGMRIEHDLALAMRHADVLKGLKTTSTERIREEMTKAFAFSTLDTLEMLFEFPDYLDIMTERGIWLKPVVEKPKGN
jgi:tRNA nucleotidyltransferase/poly(A) polymerase